MGTDEHTERTPRAIVRYPILFLCGPIFLAGAIRADPPFSAGLKVDGAALLGSLFWLGVVFKLAGFNLTGPREVYPKPGSPTQIEVFLSNIPLLILPMLGIGIGIAVVTLAWKWFHD